MARCVCCPHTNCTREGPTELEVENARLKEELDAARRDQPVHLRRPDGVDGGGSLAEAQALNARLVQERDALTWAVYEAHIEREEERWHEIDRVSSGNAGEVQRCTCVTCARWRTLSAVHRSLIVACVDDLLKGNQPLPESGVEGRQPPLAEQSNRAKGPGGGRDGGSIAGATGAQSPEHPALARLDVAASVIERLGDALGGTAAGAAHQEATEIRSFLLGWRAR